MATSFPKGRTWQRAKIHATDVLTGSFLGVVLAGAPALVVTTGVGILAADHDLASGWLIALVVAAFIATAILIWLITALFLAVRYHYRRDSGWTITPAANVTARGKLALITNTAITPDDLSPLECCYRVLPASDVFTIPDADILRGGEGSAYPSTQTSLGHYEVRWYGTHLSKLTNKSKFYELARSTVTVT
jgi:hypothetical protein